MPIKNECFSGVWLSQIFSDSLLNNSKLILKNGFSFFDVVELAIADVFSDVVSDLAWSLSFEYFEEHCANEFDYSANGDVFE